MNIMFDLDDTIYNLAGPFELAHNDLFAKLVDAPCDKLFELSRYYSTCAMDMVAKGTLPKEEEYNYRIIHTYHDYGLDLTKDQSQEFIRRYRYYQKHIQIPEKMKALLTELKEKGVTIGIISNGRNEFQQVKVDVLGLEDYIDGDHIFFSENFPKRKPDVRIFQGVANILGLDPEVTWYVGDEFAADIVGAQNAGWHNVWFNHRGRQMPEGATAPENEVRSLDEMRELFLKLIELKY